METNFHSFNLGGQEFINKNYLKAVLHYTDAMSENPWMNFSRAYLFRGLSYAYLGHLENAMDDLIEAERVIKDDPKLYYHRARVFRALEKNKECYSDLKHALNLKPTLLYYEELAATAYVLNLFDESIDYYSKCVQLAERKGMYYFNRAIVKKRSGNIQSYIEDIKLSAAFGFAEQAKKEEIENPQFFK